MKTFVSWVIFHWEPTETIAVSEYCLIDVRVNDYGLLKFFYNFWVPKWFVCNDTCFNVEDAVKVKSAKLIDWHDRTVHNEVT